MLAALVLAVMGQAIGAQSAGPVDATRLTVSPARQVIEVDTSKAKGDPVCLAWSQDGSLLYLRTAEYDRWRNEKAQHFVVPSAGGALSPVDGQPPWVDVYWLWKAGATAPGVPGMKLETERQDQMKTAVGSVADGGLSQSRADPSQSQIASDNASMQRIAKITVRLKKEVIVQAVNTSIIPGLTFGWAPSPMAALAFADGKRHLVLIDREGRKLGVTGASDVLLPAWSPDGTRIAYVQKTGRKKYVVNVVEVASR